MLATSVAAYGIGTGVHRSLAGKGVLAARWQFAPACAGSKSAETEIPCKTASKLGIQGLMA